MQIEKIPGLFFDPREGVPGVYWEWLILHDGRVKAVYTYEAIKDQGPEVCRREARRRAQLIRGPVPDRILIHERDFIPAL